jgi:aminopeptidase
MAAAPLVRSVASRSNANMTFILVIMRPLANDTPEIRINGMILTEFDYNQYARLLLEIGINLQKGQNLMIRCHTEGVLFARYCAETAYKMGAGIVDVRLKDTHVLKARINAQAGDETALGAAPGWTGAWETAILEDNWAFLALESFENVGLMADADQDALAVYERHQTGLIRRFRDAISSHAIPWCVAGVPGDKWAKRVLGEDKNADDLWRILVPILLLDQADPAEAWKKKADTLVERSDKLNSLRLDSIRFKGNGTDLTVGLLRQSVWVGGGERCEGRMTMPNIPTEEIFTTPDRRRCDGKVRITRPVEVRGTLVKGAVLGIFRREIDILRCRGRSGSSGRLYRNRSRCLIPGRGGFGG